MAALCWHVGSYFLEQGWKLPPAVECTVFTQGNPETI